MSKPNNFINDSDYATLKNDNLASVSVYLPALVLNANELQTRTQDINVGTLNASTRVRINSSKDGIDYYAGNLIAMQRIGQISGPINVGYNISGFLSRIDETTVRATISVWNPYNEGMGMAFGTETLTFEISTFLSPFV